MTCCTAGIRDENIAHEKRAANREAQPLFHPVATLEGYHATCDQVDWIGLIVKRGRQKRDPGVFCAARDARRPGGESDGRS